MTPADPSLLAQLRQLRDRVAEYHLRQMSRHEIAMALTAILEAPPARQDYDASWRTASDYKGSPHVRTAGTSWRLVRAGETAPLQGGHGSWVETDHPAVVACMGSEETPCAGAGCQYRRVTQRAETEPTSLAITQDTSDGYHTFRELYAYRKAYNALLFNEWARAGRYGVHKSWKHSDGQPCFDGGWFIVSAQTPVGQVSNHYRTDEWDLFQVPERETAEPWDGHTPQIALTRLLALAAPTPDPPAETCAECRHAAHQPGRCLNAASDNECACGARVPRPDTPTGLAPLILDGMTDAVLAEYVDFAREFDTPITATAIILNLTWELDAQRQAPASVRREAIEECIALVNTHQGAEFKCEYVARLEALRDYPRVSPRPPSSTVVKSAESSSVGSARRPLTTDRTD